jgi:signal transduction histidine kinase
MPGTNDGRKSKNLRAAAEAMLLNSSSDMNKLASGDIESLIHDLQVHQYELESQNEELKRTRLELEQARDVYADLYDFAPVGYLGLDKDNVIQKANLTASELLGVERGNLTGMRFFIFLDRASTDIFYLHRRKALETGVRQACDVVIRRADESVFYARLVSMKSGDGALRIAVIDISEKKLVDDALEAESARLEAANQELDAFAYSISHDLQAPLRAIDGYSRMLLKNEGDKLSDEGKGRLKALRNNARRMGRLINDLLSFSRLGRQVMTLTIIDMENLARQVWTDCLDDNPGRRITLRLHALPKACGDVGLIRQVLSNLMRNAIKFTMLRDDAVIEIGGNEEKGAGENVYWIRDNGAGFDMAYQDKLFGVFQRLHGEDEFEGTGVGLAIVHRIIHRHGGNIWAEGKVNEGATFHFTLPGKG